LKCPAEGKGKASALSADGSEASPDSHDVVIVVIGETPYAEGQGDISKYQTLEHAQISPDDLALLDSLRTRGVPVVTLFLSGRPLYVNRDLNRSDAFVAAWLDREAEGRGDRGCAFQ